MVAGIHVAIPNLLVAFKDFRHGLRKGNSHSVILLLGGKSNHSEVTREICQVEGKPFHISGN